MDEEEEPQSPQEYYEDEEMRGRIINPIQFTDKIIEPNMNLIKYIEKAFGKTKTRELIECIKIAFSSTTRDYSLSNLDKPSNKNTFDFADFCHNEKIIMLFSNRVYLGLALDAIMKGGMLLTRSINMKQQELFQTAFLRKESRRESEKKGLRSYIRKPF